VSTWHGPLKTWANAGLEIETLNKRAKAENARIESPGGQPFERHLVRQTRGDQITPRSALTDGDAAGGPSVAIDRGTEAESRPTVKVSPIWASCARLL
jgi:hypothetical protein